MSCSRARSRVRQRFKMVLLFFSRATTTTNIELNKNIFFSFFSLAGGRAVARIDDRLNGVCVHRAAGDSADSAMHSPRSYTTIERRTRVERCRRSLLSLSLLFLFIAMSMFCMMLAPDACPRSHFTVI